MYTSENVKAWEGSELTEFLKYHNHLSFRSALDQITAWHWFETTWTWGLHDNRFEPAQLRPYTRHYFKGDILAEEVMSDALATIVNTETKPPSFYLTPEEFETVIQDSQHLHESLDEFMERLTAAVLSKGGKERPLNAVSGKEELIRRAVDADAPDYIRESNLWLTEQKYLLWKLPGDRRGWWQIRLS